jgi:hypothetical protein
VHTWMFVSKKRRRKVYSSLRRRNHMDLFEKS